MRSHSYFEQGVELYQKQDYSKAVELFKLSIGKNFDTAAHAWLGQCYEYGLGVAKDLVEAKDLYTVGFSRLGLSEANSSLADWLAGRLEVLKHIPCAVEKSRFIEGIGNVKVRKTRSADRPQIRYNTDESVVVIHTSDPFCRGLLHAQETIPQLNKEWTCDGVTRFYDGYTLRTDYFTLKVSRGRPNSSSGFGSPGCSNPGRFRTFITKAADTPNEHYLCTLEFPAEANLEYIYVQKTIMDKVCDMLYGIAQEVLPKKLKEVADIIGITYQKCVVTRNGHGSYSACNYARGKSIEMRTTCIQLPIETLEALCVHELTHNFVTPHNKEFYDKLIELGNRLPIGGEAIYNLDRNIFNEGKWRYLKF